MEAEPPDQRYQAGTWYRKIATAIDGNRRIVALVDAVIPIL